MSFGRTAGGVPSLWNPGTGIFTAVPSPSLLFCSGHVLLPNGRLFVAGGHIQDGLGLPNANIFDYATGTWTARAPMARGRWYPTAVTMANGEVVVMGGTDQSGATVLIPEVWKTTGGWRALTTASMWMPYYPRAFLAPNGRLFYAGEMQQTSYLDAAGTGAWQFVANRVVANRDYGSAVMYQPGKILYVGGGSPPTATAGSCTPAAAMPLSLQGAPPHYLHRPVQREVRADLHRRHAQPDQYCPSHLGPAHVDHPRLRHEPAVYRGERYPGRPTLSVKAPTMKNRVPPGHYMMFLIDTAEVPSIVRIVQIK